MDYKKAYEEALERAKSYQKLNKSAVITAIFPELRENEKDRIKQDIITTLSIGVSCDESTLYPGAHTTLKEAITWLEKQGEKKDLVTNQSDCVDLGLPSGTLWCKHNLGAEKETDFGLYYQWGDTKGYRTDEGHQFSWDTYKYGTYWNDIIKYNNTDGKLVLDNEDDPIYFATRGKMKCPTKEQFKELIDYTNHNWVEIDGVKGMKFINKNDDTKYIFIPAAGSCDNGNHYDIGSWCRIWSASRYEFNASCVWSISFNVVNVDMYSFYRCRGFSMRGVANEPLK